MSTGTYLKLWEEDGGSVCLEADSRNPIDAAVSTWLDTKRDSLLYLTTIAGEEFVTRASRVTSWLVSTPEGRSATIAYEKAAVDEERANRVAVGLPWDEE